jgi:hypothetical protein
LTCSQQTSAIAGAGILTNFPSRRLWSDVRSDHRFRTIREEDDARAAQAGQWRAERRGRCDSRLDAQVLHAGRVGEEEECARILNQKTRRTLYQCVVRWLSTLRPRCPFGSADCRTATGVGRGSWELGKLELPSVSATTKLFAGDKTLCGLSYTAAGVA